MPSPSLNLPDMSLPAIFKLVTPDDVEKLFDM